SRQRILRALGVLGLVRCKMHSPLNKQDASPIGDARGPMTTACIDRGPPEYPTRHYRLDKNSDAGTTRHAVSVWRDALAKPPRLPNPPPTDTGSDGAGFPDQTPEPPRPRLAACHTLGCDNCHRWGRWHADISERTTPAYCDVLRSCGVHRHP